MLLGGVILGQGLSVPALLVQQTRQVNVSIRVISWTLIHQGLGPRQILLPISETLYLYVFIIYRYVTNGLSVSLCCYIVKPVMRSTLPLALGFEEGISPARAGAVYEFGGRNCFHMSTIDVLL